MGDWADGYFRVDRRRRQEADTGALPSPARPTCTTGCPTASPCQGAPHRAAAVQWLGASSVSRKAQDTFNPLKGSIPARKDANVKLYPTYLKYALSQWKGDSLAGSLTHGVVASNKWNTDIDSALGLFLQTKNVARFQSALVAAAKKNA